MSTLTSSCSVRETKRNIVNFIYEFAKEGRCIVSTNYGCEGDQKPQCCQTHCLAGMKNYVEIKGGCEVVICPIICAFFVFLVIKKQQDAEIILQRE